MILDLVEVILKNYRNRVQWKVCQSSEVLAKGSDDIDDLWDIIKTTEYNPLTEKEIMEKKEIAAKKQREKWDKIRKKEEKFRVLYRPSKELRLKKDTLPKTKPITKDDSVPAKTLKSTKKDKK